MQFCETMEYLTATQSSHLYRIYFSDEAIKMVKWLTTNIGMITILDGLEKLIQNPENLNIWAGIMCNTVIGTFLIAGNPTERLYL